MSVPYNIPRLALVAPTGIMEAEPGLNIDASTHETVCLLLMGPDDPRILPRDTPFDIILAPRTREELFALALVFNQLRDCCLDMAGEMDLATDR